MDRKMPARCRCLQTKRHPAALNLSVDSTLEREQPCPRVAGFRSSSRGQGYVFTASAARVAQTASLLYRRMPSGRTVALAGTSELRQRPADWPSAIRQITNPRYAKQIRTRLSALLFWGLSPLFK